MVRKPSRASGASGASRANNRGSRSMTAHIITVLLLFAVLPCVRSSAQCSGAPTYSCARTDTNVTHLPSPLPFAGGLTGANTQFSDTSFNPSYPIRYTRVTDSTTGTVLGNTNSPMGVGSGDGDDSHFNADESLFTFTDNGAAWYFYGLNTSTMQTGYVWASTATSNIQFSQSNRNYAYEAANTSPYMSRIDFTGCYLNGPTCNPPVTTEYIFSNCGMPSTAGFFENAGVAYGDTVFAAAEGPPDTNYLAHAYVVSTSTCYLYNTAAGVIRQYVGSQTPTTGSATCNGTSTVTGSGFQTGTAWVGVPISLGSAGVFYVASVASSTSLTLGLSQTCASGSYSYSLTPGTYLGAVTAGTDLYYVHNIHINANGSWMNLDSGGCASGTCVGIEDAWEIGTTTTATCPSSSSDQGSCESHGTNTNANWINGDNNFANSKNPSMQSRSWANFATTNDILVTQLNTVNTTINASYDQHPTTKNDPQGTHTYPVIADTYAPNSPAGTITDAFDNEVIAWTQTPGPVLRFGHTFNSSLLTTSVTGQYAIGSVSPLGDFYLFTSDGEGTLGNNNGTSSCSLTGNTCRTDVFLVQLTAQQNAIGGSGTIGGSGAVK